MIGACCADAHGRRLSATKLVHGVANLGLWLKNNMFNRGESFGEFQMSRQETITVWADFG
jgi:hypothetical protein